MESVKTQWQASPKNRNEIQIFKQIWTEKGFYKGFYAGSLPNCARVVLKNIYRYPMMIGVPNAIEKTIPLARNDRRISKGLTGLSIACVESAILCPAERLKVYLMTNNLIKSDLSLYTRFKADS